MVWNKLLGSSSSITSNFENHKSRCQFREGHMKLALRYTDLVNWGVILGMILLDTNSHLEILEINPQILTHEALPLDSNFPLFDQCLSHLQWKYTTETRPSLMEIRSEKILKGHKWFLSILYTSSSLFL